MKPTVVKLIDANKMSSATEASSALEGVHFAGSLWVLSRAKKWLVRTSVYTCLLNGIVGGSS